MLCAPTQGSVVFVCGAKICVLAWASYPIKNGLLTAINLYGTGGFSLATKPQTVLVCHLTSDCTSAASHKKGAEKLRKFHSFEELPVCVSVLDTRGIKKKVQDWFGRPGECCIWCSTFVHKAEFLAWKFICGDCDRLAFCAAQTWEFLWGSWHPWTRMFPYSFDTVCDGKSPILGDQSDSD